MAVSYRKSRVSKVPGSAATGLPKSPSMTGGLAAPAAPKPKPKPKPAAPPQPPAASSPAPSPGGYEPPYYDDGPRAVQAEPAPAPETPESAASRVNAARDRDIGLSGVKDSIYRAALDYGDYATAGQYGPAVTDNPNSAQAKIERSRQEGLRQLDESSNRGNTFFSGLHLRDIGLNNDAATRALQDAYTQYTRAVADANARRDAILAGYEGANANADAANIREQLNNPVEPKGPLLDDRPKLVTPTSGKTVFGSKQMATEFNALPTRGDQEAFQKYLGAAGKAGITALLPNAWVKAGKPSQATPTGRGAFGGKDFNDHFNRISAADQKAFQTYMAATVKAGKQAMDPWLWIQKGRPKQ